MPFFKRRPPEKPAMLSDGKPAPVRYDPRKDARRRLTTLGKLAAPAVVAGAVAGGLLAGKKLANDANLIHDIRTWGMLGSASPEARQAFEATRPQVVRKAFWAGASKGSLFGALAGATLGLIGWAGIMMTEASVRRSGREIIDSIDHWHRRIQNELRKNKGPRRGDGNGMD